MGSYWTEAHINIYHPIKYELIHQKIWTKHLNILHNFNNKA